MNSEKIARSNITDMGRTLLEEGLVARTWGNISERISEHEFLITPSGLAYTETKDEDLAVYDLSTGEWRGPHKPSGERKVHAIAYSQFPEVNFVIHTHQSYATALGVAGFERLEISDEERERLGGVAVSEYGLPGQKKLNKAVLAAMSTGAHVILMKYHGVLVAGTDKEDAFARVKLLEEICRRSYKGGDFTDDAEELPDYSGIVKVQTPAALKWSESGLPLVAQLDDMAQMIGRVIPVAASEAEAEKMLAKKCAVFVKGGGALVRGRDADDTQALTILVEKAAVTALQARACGVKVKMNPMDIFLQNLVYQKKYSKQKNAAKSS